MNVYNAGANKQLLADYLKAPSHGLIISAPPGFGKSQILDYISAQLLSVAFEKLQQSPSYKLIESEKSIGIDDIREVKKFLKLKQGSDVSPRVLAIKDCNRMTAEAQNSFLKILEEPPESTYFIMSAQTVSTLLPTIKSRVRIIELRPYSQEELRAYFTKQGYALVEIDRAYLMSGGLFREMQEILGDSYDGSNFEQAKTIISSNHYQRLLIVDSLSKDKVQTKNLLYALRRTLLVAIHTDNVPIERVKKLHKAIIAVNKSEDLINNSNPNLKLLLSNLMLTM